MSHVHMYLCGDVDSLKLETVKYIENTTLLKSYRNAISVVKNYWKIFPIYDMLSFGYNGVYIYQPH